MSNFSAEQTHMAAEVLMAARRKGLMLAAAESCTGGIISGCLTEIPGSSDVFDRGFISYSYDAKEAQLGVSRQTIATHGAVSAETVLEMAAGALKNSHAGIAVAVTGIAGPGGATPEKPIGMVYIGIANGKTGETRAVLNHFDGNRAAIRNATLDKALEMIAEEIEKTI